MACHRFVNLFWHEEMLYSSAKTSVIEVPRKDGTQYCVGEKVQARYSGKLYPATIMTIKDTKPELLEDAEKLQILVREQTSFKDVLNAMGMGMQDMQEPGEGINSSPATSASSPHTLDVADKLVSPPIPRAPAASRMSATASSAPPAKKPRQSSVAFTLDFSDIGDTTSVRKTPVTGKSSLKKPEKAVPVLSKKIPEEQLLALKQQLRKEMTDDIQKEVKKQVEEELKKLCEDWDGQNEDVKRCLRRTKRLEEKFQKITGREEASSTLPSTSSGPSSASPSTPKQSPIFHIPSSSTPVQPCHSPFSSSQPHTPSNPSVIYFNGLTEEDLRKGITDTDATKIAKSLARKMFTTEQLLHSSFSGKPTVQNYFKPRPALDGKARDTILKLTKEAVPGTDFKIVYAAVTNLQKVLRAKAKQNINK